MTYVAAAGDTGAQVAVAGGVAARARRRRHQPQWSGTGTRYEAAWRSTGGGVSAYEAAAGLAERRDRRRRRRAGDAAPSRTSRSTPTRRPASTSR